MAGTYNQGVFRTGTYGTSGSGSDPLVPEPVSAQIIQELPKASQLLQRAAHVPMSSKTDRLPVLDVLPVAYWVGGDTGLSQTTQQEWKNVQLVAEELATIVPIPISYLDDADMPVWDQVKPRLAEACGRLIDLSGMWGIGAPNTWSTSLYAGAVAAGNVVTAGTSRDAGVDISVMGEMVAQDGYSLDGWCARPGYTWKLSGMRAGGNLPASGGSGVPIWQSDMQAGVQAGQLYGYPLSEVKNGSWQAGTDLIGGDWTKCILGVRQDISFSMFSEGVVSDDTGKVILNLMQQNAVAMRVTMRVAFATANPVTAVNANAATRYPFVVLQDSQAS